MANAILGTIELVLLASLMAIPLGVAALAGSGIRGLAISVATLIGLLRRAEGATLGQMVEATGWQSHTVRGTLAGALKKKLGLTIVSAKTDGPERTYRIA